MNIDKNAVAQGLRALGAALVLALVVALSGCSAAQTVQNELGIGGNCSGPTTAVIPDVSASTAVLRKDGTMAEQAIKAMRWTAQRCGVAFMAPADGAAIANGKWVIDDEDFKSAGFEDLGGKAGELVRKGAADREVKKIQEAIAAKPKAAGSDLLGAVTRLADADLPKGTENVLVLITDGAINVPGVASVYATPIDTERRRKKFVARLKAAGEIPDLEGWTVYVTGVGLGVGDRNLAANLRRLWRDEIVPAMNAKLGGIDSSLRLG